MHAFLSFPIVQLVSKLSTNKNEKVYFESTKNNDKEHKFRLFLYKLGGICNKKLR